MCIQTVKAAYPAVALVALVMARKCYILVPSDVSNGQEGVRISVSQVSALQPLLSRMVQPMARIGADPADSDQVRFQKTLAVTAALVCSVPPQVGLIRRQRWSSSS